MGNDLRQPTLRRTLMGDGKYYCVSVARVIATI